MPRTVTVKLGGTEFHMPATYRASKEIAEKVGDPIDMIMEVASGKTLKQEQIVSIIYIGAKNAGCGLDQDAVGEALVEAGLVDSGATAMEYINSIMSGGPERSVEGKKKPSRKPG